MEKLPSRDLQAPALKSALQSIWGAVSHASDMKELLKGTASLAQRPFKTPAGHIHGIVSTGDAIAMHAALKWLPEEHVQMGYDLFASSERDGVQESLTDVAISSGSPPMAKLVHEKALLLDLDTVLVRYEDKKECHRFLARGQIAHFRAHHAVTRLQNSAEDMAEFLLIACEHEQLDMAQVIWNLAGSKLVDKLEEEQKKALVELGGNAAAAGRLEFLELLVSAKAPLDHAPERTQQTMIRRAAMAGNAAEVRLLAKKGASLCGAVSEAACYGHLETMKILLDELKADVNDRCGDEVFACAAGQAIAANQLEALQLLHQKKAVLDDEEFIELAERFGSKDCLAFLQKLRYHSE